MNNTKQPTKGVQMLRLILSGLLVLGLSPAVSAEEEYDTNYNETETADDSYVYEETEEVDSYADEDAEAQKKEEEAKKRKAAKKKSKKKSVN